MPRRDEHLRQAQRNEAFYQYAGQSPQPYHEWRVTLLFYIALHYVDAARAQRNLHPNSHSQRSEMVYQYLRRIMFDYRSLRDASELARYQLVPFTAVAVQQLEQGAYARVRAYLRARLNLPL